MEDKAYLKYLINDQIYVVNEPPIRVAESQNTTVTKEESRESADKLESSELQLEKSPHNKPIPKTPTRKLLVIFEYQDSEALAVNLKKLMLKIVEAVGIDVMTGVYVNSSFKSIPEDLHDFENILVFGSQISIELGSEIRQDLYQIDSIESTRILKSDGLTDLDQQVPLKRQLWGALQEMFPNH